ncbi:very short patch repair endonuclease [Flavobacterium sp. RHBU_3]|uniref:very short patch repair endonuclease n=1 Tax=Flavobacterium sp. RHBU_3 TaxID=3391184 RepID=UPI003984838F
MDVHNKEQRSKNMAAIKSKATKCEVALGKRLWAEGLRYRKNDKTVFGKPDFTFKKYKLAIFIDSEFFHGKDFETKKQPATNTDFWVMKIARNIERDKLVNSYLAKEGWTILRFWSDQVKKDVNMCVQRIIYEVSKVK